MVEASFGIKGLQARTEIIQAFFTIRGFNKTVLRALAPAQVKIGTGAAILRQRVTLGEGE
jgi:hypothetical protein